MQLVGLQENYQQFKALGAEIVALATAPRQSVRQARDAANAQYPMLADPDHLVAEAYQVYNLLGDGYAAPAVFIIDPSGQITWSYIGEHYTDRPTVSDILSQLQ